MCRKDLFSLLFKQRSKAGETHHGWTVKHRMVAVSTMKTENGKVSCETPEGAVINININQRSCLDSLLDAIRNARIVKKAGGDTTAARKSASGVYLGVGVCFMNLGFISVVLAVICSVIRLDLYSQYFGTHYWVGFPFLVAGILNIVAYKYPKALWVVIAFISLLGALAVSIAGMVFVIHDVSSFSWGQNMEHLCDNIRQNDYYRTMPPRYNPYDNSEYDLQNCKREFQNYKNLKLGLVIMSLLMVIWGLCVSAVTLIFRLKAFFRACRCEKVEEEAVDSLLSPNLTQDIIA